MTLSAENFVRNGTAVSVSGAGTAVTAVNVTSPTSLSATFNNRWERGYRRTRSWNGPNSRLLYYGL